MVEDQHTVGAESTTDVGSTTQWEIFDGFLFTVSPTVVFALEQPKPPRGGADYAAGVNSPLKETPLKVGRLSPLKEILLPKQDVVEEPATAFPGRSESRLDSVVLAFFQSTIAPAAVPSSSLLLEQFYQNLAFLLGFPAPTRDASPKDRVLLRNAAILHGALFSYSFAYHLVDPIVLPNLVTEYTGAESTFLGSSSNGPAGPVEFGKLQSTFAVSQIVSSHMWYG